MGMDYIATQYLRIVLEYGTLKITLLRNPETVGDFSSSKTFKT